MPPFETLQSQAQRLTTPCGDGDLVWYRWGSGPVLVLLHGGTGSWRHFARNIGFFAERYTVLAADMPGLGESAMAPGPAEPHSVAAALAASLAELLGPDRHYDLAGFSFGSNIGTHLAAIEGVHIRSHTIVGAASLGFQRQPVQLLKIRDKTGEERVATHRLNLNALMLKNPDLIDDEAVAIQDWNTVHARLRSRGFASGSSLKDQLPHVKAPMRAIWGEFDQVAWPHIPERLAMLHAARPELISEVISGAGHWVMYEAPDAFNTALLRMLQAR
jgi:pimeloyl-ACP methyl ester carboxylesterase